MHGSIKWPILAAAAIFGSAQSSFVSADPGFREIYEVKAAAGQVLTRTPNGSHWQALKLGDRIPEGQLIQVAPSARLVLNKIIQSGKDVGGLAAHDASLIISSPLLGRVGPDLLKTVSLSQHFIKELPNLVADKEAVNSPPQFWDEAWQRLALLLSRQGAPKATLAALGMTELEKQGVALAVSSKRLRILAPAADSIIVADTLPIELRIAWSDADEDEPNYQIFIWPRTAERGTIPFALSPVSHYSATLPARGSFFIQVVTRDGRWQSIPQLLHVSPREALDVERLAEKIVLNEIDAKSDAKLIDMDFPPEAYTYGSRGNVGKLSFYWHGVRDGNLTATSTETLVIQSESDGVAEVRIDSVVRRIDDVVLPSGDYRWFVMTKFKDGDKTREFRSASRRLSVKSTAGTGKKALLDQALTPGVHGTFELVDGL